MDAIVIEPPNSVTASIIWLHGLGASGHDFEPLIPELPTSLTQQTRFIFPHAPNRPISVNMGMVMPGWYDVVALDLTSDQDEAGIRDSEKLVQTYLQQEEDKGIAAERIVLAGFSQGGAIALHVGLRYPHKLAGIIALSTYLPLGHTLQEERHPANQSTPIFYGHGRYDAIIPLHQGQESHQYLSSLDYQVDWRDYLMEHSVCQQEITDIGDWLTTVLN